VIAGARLLDTTPCPELLDELRGICSEAAAAILCHYVGDEAARYRTKSDASPVTAADLAAHSIIVTGLAHFGLPVLSEESAPEHLRERLDWERFWMVDPLDGTREFLERTGDFTINIALIDCGRAVLGVIAAPLRGEIYAGVPGAGAWKHGEGAWRDIACRSIGEARPLRVLTSRRHGGEKLEACLAELAKRPGGIERECVGSALKFCLLAEGRADFYPRFAPCSEWDTAAGQALLEGAGGAVLMEDGSPLRYNQGEALASPHFLALAEPGHPVWTQAGLLPAPVRGIGDPALYSKGHPRQR